MRQEEVNKIRKILSKLSPERRQELFFEMNYCVYCGKDLLTLDGQRIYCTCTKDD